MITKKRISKTSIVVCIVAMLLVAGIGRVISELGPWYQALRVPPWQPPGAVFGIVWTTIYVLTTISAILAWRDVDKRLDGGKLIGLFALNCILNVMWSFIFFKLHRPDLAALQVGFFWLSILALIVFIWPRNKVASLMLLPYIVWVSIASALNFSVVQLNGPFS